MSLSKKEVIVQIIDDAFAVALKETSQAFSWELFWQFDVVVKLYDYNMQLMDHALSEENRNDFTKDDLIDIKSSVVADIIKDRKSILMSKYNIELVPFAVYRNQIVTFFKEHRNIDFNGLDENTEKSLLQNEDIMISENMLHLALNMTHMQFKHLYQKGEVYLAV